MKVSEELIMPAGRFRGQPIDTRFRRTAVLTEECERYYTAAFFYHRGRFYTAQIPKDSVEAIVGQRFNFYVQEESQATGSLFWNPFLNHVQVRFILCPGAKLRLYSSECSDLTKPAAELSEFVYSLEVAGPRGVQWALRYGFGDFIAAHRILSIEEVVFERVVKGRYLVQQTPPLLLSHDERQQALDLVLRRSTAAGMHERYYVVSVLLGARNCTSEPFRLLDSLLMPRYSRLQRIAAALFWRLPLNPLRYLKLRGVIDGSLRQPTLNEEFRDLSNSPALRQRLAAMTEKTAAAAD